MNKHEHRNPFSVLKSRCSLTKIDWFESELENKSSLTSLIILGLAWAVFSQSVKAFRPGMRRSSATSSFWFTDGLVLVELELIIVSGKRFRPYLAFSRLMAVMLNWFWKMRHISFKKQNVNEVKKRMSLAETGWEFLSESPETGVFHEHWKVFQFISKEMLQENM